MVTKYGKKDPTKPVRLSLKVIKEIEAQAIYGETSPNQVLTRILQINKKKLKEAKLDEHQKRTASKL